MLWQTLYNHYPQASASTLLPIFFIFYATTGLIIYNRINEIAAADKETFKRIVSSDDDGIVASWNSRLTVGNKDVGFSIYGIFISSTDTSDISDGYQFYKKLYGSTE